MSALLFVVVFALLLGAAQLLGWTRDSRDANDWRPTDNLPPEHTRPEPARSAAADPPATDPDRHHAAP